MTSEEYFAKEFKKFIEYKQHVLNGADYMQDSRVSFLMHNFPTSTAMNIDHAMQSQIDLLHGADICNSSQSRDVSAFTNFLTSALPMNYAKVAPEFIEYCLIRNIDTPYFSDLNGSIIKLQARDIYTKRMVDSDSKFIKDTSGSFLTRQVPIPQGSRVVLSKKNIHLCNFKTLENGRRIKSSPPDGFGYLDYVDTPEGRGYLYFIPKDYIYPVNLNVLVLSTSRLTVKYYWGRQYTFNRGVSSAYLYIAPYAESVLKSQNVVFCLKSSLDYDQEIQQLENYWQSCIGANGLPRPSILYPFDKTTVYTVMNYASDDGGSNLAYRTLPEPDRDPYVRYSKSLADLDKSKTIQDEST